ncbi:MAG: single-stranded-DNA-specific exonuclease RecJ [Deltaproteobacteria bacterium]|jgi:single-stranded-DNA-specific exonuclease|nr:single-stranded-DNA-specific exonuclease RecJ [Deltaproteobacteria bacterium]
MANWKYRTRDPKLAEAIALEMDKPLLFGDFIVGRGIMDAASAKTFIEASLTALPDPFSMPGMRNAVDLLVEAKERGAVVGISGDYDVDGLTATALLVRVLGALGFKVTHRIPHRLDEGYGLSEQAVREIHAGGASYLITVDSGVSDSGAVQLATDLGLKVIITDHHHLPPSLPEAAAIINPHLGGGFEETPLAGVGVAFMLAWGLRNALNEVKAELNLVEHLALVALGTVADLAPLQGANRAMVYHGLKFLNVTKWPGLVALKRVLKMDGQNRVSAKDVGFKMAPRLNAAGRMGSPQPALDILLTNSPVAGARLADELENINKFRFESQANLLEDALELMEHECPPDSRTVVLCKEGWQKGVLGLAASRVVEKFGKPTILMTIKGDQATGSGRTVGNFDLFAALSKVRHLCVSMGGHSAAAGLTVAVDRLEEFKAGFEKATSEQGDDWGQNDLQVDLVAELPDLQPLSPHLAELEPFGVGHPAPVVAIMGLTILQALSAKGGRLDLRLSDGLNRLNVSGYNLAPRLEEVGPKMDVVLTYDPESNYNGHHWRLIDFRRPLDAAQ